MSGVFANIEFKHDAIQRKLNQLRRFPEQDVQEVFYDLGPHLMRSMLKRGKQGVDPDGRKWQPLSDAYAKWKKKKRPTAGILFFDRHMLGDMFSYRAGTRDLQIGTNAIYGAAHHWGSKKNRIPGRPFVGFSTQDKTDILDILSEHIIRLAARP